MKIRPAEKKDLLNCKKLYSIPELACANGHYLSVEEMEDYIDDDFFLVAEDNGQIIGSIFGEKIKAGGAMLWMFAVDKNYRNAGIGTKLFSAFEKNCHRYNVTWIILYAPVENEDTKRFYKNKGFDLGRTYVENVKNLS